MGVQLAPKRVLALKNEQASLTVDKLRVVLEWVNGSSPADQVDFDLMVFYKTTDGKLGGVFSNNFPCGYLGSLQEMPYMQLDGDDGVAGDADSVGPQDETILIGNLDNIEEAYIVALNYTDAANNTSRTFSQLNGRIKIASNTPQGIDNLEVPLNGTENGVAAIVAKISGPIGAKVLTNMSRVVSLQTLLADVPAADLLTKTHPSAAQKGVLV